MQFYAACLIQRLWIANCQGLSGTRFYLQFQSQEEVQGIAAITGISLINADCKIVAEILALQLQSVSPSALHANHTSFAKGRHWDQVAKPSVTLEYQYCTEASSSRYPSTKLPLLPFP